ncbi:probable transcriptional regulator [Tenacibaculum maritimum]|uniref:LexA family transcriptional regulator n=1 Tax=Tenacibaculum maritimum TaxID=107401 RepID=UPI0012E63E24|nr:LexA family transcriptional regulator [Tenacibaculum maritimum]CAA0159931.1 probable transcriptional regulator [Tenacibaculum maritimum]
MGSINDRFKELVDYFSKGNNSDFASKIGINEANVRNYINKTEPKYNVLEKIAKTFEINYEWLLTGRNEMLKKEFIANPTQSKTPQVITITPDNEDNIVLVPIKAQAGYLNGYNDPHFIQNLPSYNLPNMRNGVFRMFQIKGHSMYPTMHSNSYVVGQFIEDWVNDIKDNRIYVVITEDGVVIKRVLNRIEKYGNIYCKSDNRREYPSFPVEPKDIKEVWECKMLLSYEFLDPVEIHDKVYDLEAKVLNLEHILNKK